MPESFLPSGVSPYHGKRALPGGVLRLVPAKCCACCASGLLDRIDRTLRAVTCHVLSVLTFSCPAGYVLRLLAWSWRCLGAAVAGLQREPLVRKCRDTGLEGVEVARKAEYDLTPRLGSKWL